MKKITVSIIIPTRNRSKQLQRLMDAIGKSSYTDFEIIIVNDHGEPVAEQTRKQATFVLVNKSNTGLAYSRSAGAKVARGEFLLFIDDDNVVDKNMIENLVSSLKENPQLLAVGPITYYLSNKNRIWFLSVTMNLLTSRPTFYYNVLQKRIWEKHLFLTDNLHNCFMIRKKNGDEVGWLDKKIFMNGTEYDLFMRIKKLHPNMLLATDLDAVCFHDVPELSANNLRSLGFETTRRVYYFARNRGVFAGRYGSWSDKLGLSIVFYPVVFFVYASLFLLKGRIDFLWYHIKGISAGYYYLLNGGIIHEK